MTMRRCHCMPPECIRQRQLRDGFRCGVLIDGVPDGAPPDRLAIMVQRIKELDRTATDLAAGAPREEGETDFPTTGRGHGCNQCATLEAEVAYFNEAIHLSPKAGRAERTERLRELFSDIDDGAAAEATLEAEVQRLREAIKQFGDHTVGCAISQFRYERQSGYFHNPPPACTCGYLAALTAGQEPSET